MLSASRADSGSPTPRERQSAAPSSLPGRVLRRLRRDWVRLWIRLWMGLAGRWGLGRWPYRMVALAAPPYRRAGSLARLSPQGYIAPSAVLDLAEVTLGRNDFIGEGVTFYTGPRAGPIQLGDRVFLHMRTTFETGPGGEIQIGDETHIQPGCHLVSHECPIRIGKRVQIAANCGFFSYDHGIAPGVRIVDQPMTSKGPIVIEDDAWIGFGVTVLSGVTIGEGAVVGAGSVVVSDVPAGGIAVGSPARVVANRADLEG